MPEDQPHRRRRARSTPCVIPGCQWAASRGSEFPLCLDHMLRIWSRVEAGTTPPKERADALARPGLKRPPSSDEEKARALADRQRLREAATKPGTLYVLDTGRGMVKIGWTGRDLWSRLDEYPPHFRLIVSVPGTRADERDVHRSLRTSNVHGQEWYEPTSEVVRQINAWIALANMITSQRAAANRAQYADDNPDVDFAPRLLPAFTTLGQWTPHMILMSDDTKSRPGPKSRPAARRVR